MELDLLQEEEQALVSLGDGFLSLTDTNNSNSISWIEPPMSHFQDAHYVCYCDRVSRERRSSVLKTSY